MRELDFHDDSTFALIKSFPMFSPSSESQIQNHNLFYDMYINSIPTHNLTSPYLSHCFQNNIGNWSATLQSLLATGSTRPQTNTVTPSWSNIIQTIKAYKAFFSISPIPKFTDFTTDQAILILLSWFSSDSDNMEFLFSWQ
ncbi:hypothetical protein SADUNF_Sadunf11G0118800 [Salix dunnii]|uniref:Uncharacterized protein n=1 Tax=Salix dunnii TaxID=1413687 RepID=A0A835JPF1_9ROSI|nr:hypothetical protein SADUNF_Sadunf11G0118800 [Salix dunnii]